MSSSDEQDRSEYSEQTINLANEVFFICEERESPPDLIEKLEYLRQKKYSYDLDRYANYLLSPEILVATQPKKRLENIEKAFEMLMMVYLKKSSARDRDFDCRLFKLSPKLYRYRENSRNKNIIRKWTHPKKEEKMIPRILSKLIRSEAKSFISKWERFNFQWFNLKTADDWKNFYAMKE